MKSLIFASCLKSYSEAMKEEEKHKKNSVSLILCLEYFREYKSLRQMLPLCWIQKWVFHTEECTSGIPTAVNDEHPECGPA